MNPEIIKFYKDNGYLFSDFFDPKRHGGVRLSEAQIKAGARDYYNAIKSGEVKPKRISIGWGVPKWAKTARFDEFINDNEILGTYKPMLKGLSDRIDLIKERLYTWKLCFWVLLGVSVFLGLAYIDIKWGFPI